MIVSSLDISENLINLIIYLDGKKARLYYQLESRYMKLPSFKVLIEGLIRIMIKLMVWSLYNVFLYLIEIFVLERKLCMFAYI